MKKHFRGNIERLTIRNDQYRKVLYTTKNMQLVLMSLGPGQEIGMEAHLSASQFIRVEKGHATAYVGKRRYRLRDGDAIIIPPGRRHNVINTGRTKLKLYTIYSPPQH